MAYLSALLSHQASALVVRIDESHFALLKGLQMLGPDREVLDRVVEIGERREQELGLVLILAQLVHVDLTRFIHENSQIRLVSVQLFGGLATLGLKLKTKIRRSEECHAIAMVSSDQLCRLTFCKRTSFFKWTPSK